MRKKSVKLCIITLFLSILLTGCLNLKYSNEKKHENEFSDTFFPDSNFLVNREYKSGELVVGYENVESLNILIEKLKEKVVEKEIIPQIRVSLLKLNNIEVEDALDALKLEKIDGIRYIEPNFTDRKLDLYEKSSIKSATQKTNPNSDIIQTDIVISLREEQYALNLIGAEKAWESATGEGILVALLDSGVDGTHPDLVGQLIKGYDPYSRKEISPLKNSDTNGHGTHTAGIIAAKNDGAGIVGLAPNAKIMPIRIFKPAYIGDYAAAKGIIWAVDNGADILSNSWGGGGYSNVLKDAFDYALMNNVVVVASAGNGTTEQHWQYPAAYPGVIGVAASDQNDQVAYFSSRGEYISVAAPGVDIISTVPINITNNEFPYESWSGTSMACPYVSALAALIKEKNPNANVFQIKRVIETGAKDISTYGYDTASGYGRIRSYSLNLNPQDYQTGALKVLAISKRNNNLLPGVYITLENQETGKRYYGKTNEKGEELFLWIEPGVYTIILGGPDYLEKKSPNYRIQEQLSYSNQVTVQQIEYNETFEDDLIPYIQAFESTQFKITLETEENFDGQIMIELMNNISETLAGFNLEKNSKISINLLKEIDQKIQESGQKYGPNYYLKYRYNPTNLTTDFSIFVHGYVYLNHYEPIPISFCITPDSTSGSINEYGGEKSIPWTVF